MKDRQEAEHNEATNEFRDNMPWQDRGRMQRGRLWKGMLGKRPFKRPQVTAVRQRAARSQLQHTNERAGGRREALGEDTARRAFSGRGIPRTLTGAPPLCLLPQVEGNTMRDTEGAGLGRSLPLRLAA